MAIFGRKTARRRLRRAARESLAVPAFSSGVDCTAWVIGGLWPAELSTITAEHAPLAEHLKTDLHRIAGHANDQLISLRRAGMTDSTRQATEVRVINEARARAVRRIESTMRQLHSLAQGFRGEDLDATQVLPAVAAPKPEASPAGQPNRDVDQGAAQVQAFQDEVETESDDERLQRVLAFVARQEPGLNWAVGDQADGTTVLVTDLAHGWIPPRITLPEGVRLLEPERRTGKASALISSATRVVTYTPGDPLDGPGDAKATNSSIHPRELPAVEGLGWELSAATHWRDGLPRMVHTLAKAVAAGTGVAEEEIDLLRVHLDTARYRMLRQYPDVDRALLLDCMVLAATERSLTNDAISANYHLAWFRKLNAPPVSDWIQNP